MFIARDRFLYCLSYELSKCAAFCSIRKIEHGREPLGYKHFVPNGTFTDRLLKQGVNKSCHEFSAP